MLSIVTNHHPRPVVDGWELTPAERAEFDYVDWAAVDRGEDSASFVRYRGELVDLGDVPRADGELASLGWDGFASDSFYSGTAVRYVTPECDEVIVARVYSE